MPASSSAEIAPPVPLKGLRKGDDLVLQIIWQGQPLAGAKVITDFLNDSLAPPLRAVGEGRVTIALPGNGLNVIQTSHCEDCRQPCDVNLIGHSSTWSYGLPGAAE